MANVTRDFDLRSSLPALPRLRAGGFGSKIAQLLVLVFLIILLFASAVSVPTGHVGVLTLFGKVTGETLSEGIHMINPLKSVQKLSLQTRSKKESSNTPSQEGLMLALDTSLLFHLDRAKAAEVYQKVGADYVEKVVEPTLRSAIRAATSSHT